MMVTTPPDSKRTNSSLVLGAVLSGPRTPQIPAQSRRQVILLSPGYRQGTEAHWSRAFAPLRGSQSPSPSPFLFPRPSPHSSCWSCRACGFPGMSPSSRVMVIWGPCLPTLSPACPRKPDCLQSVPRHASFKAWLLSRLHQKVLSILLLHLGSKPPALTFGGPGVVCMLVRA